MQKLVQAAALQPIRSCTRELKLAIKVPDYISVMEFGKFCISHKKGGKWSFLAVQDSSIGDVVTD